MKVNKVICDICKKELDLKNDPVLGSFQKIELKTPFAFNQKIQDREKEISKEEYDLCKTCTEKIQNYILKEKK